MKKDTQRMAHPFLEWIKGTFTDWSIAIFTVVLGCVAIYQYNAMNGQLSVMRNDQRAWLKVRNPTRGQGENSHRYSGPTTTQRHLEC
jgi:hypothetical protein